MGWLIQDIEDNWLSYQNGYLTFSKTGERVAVEFASINQIGEITFTECLQNGTSYIIYNTNDPESWPTVDWIVGTDPPFFNYNYSSESFTYVELRNPRTTNLNTFVIYKGSSQIEVQLRFYNGSELVTFNCNSGCGCSSEYVCDSSGNCQLACPGFCTETCFGTCSDQKSCIANSSGVYSCITRSSNPPPEEVSIFKRWGFWVLLLGVCLLIVLTVLAIWKETKIVSQSSVKS